MSGTDPLSPILNNAAEATADVVPAVHKYVQMSKEYAARYAAAERAKPATDKASDTTQREREIPLPSQRTPLRPEDFSTQAEFNDARGLKYVTADRAAGAAAAGVKPAGTNTASSPFASAGEPREREIPLPSQHTPLRPEDFSTQAEFDAARALKYVHRDVVIEEARRAELEHGEHIREVHHRNRGFEFER